MKKLQGVYNFGNVLELVLDVGLLGLYPRAISRNKVGKLMICVSFYDVNSVFVVSVTVTVNNYGYLICTRKINDIGII